MSADRLQTKSTEASVRVPALLAAFPRLQDLIAANIPGLQDLAGLRLVPNQHEDGQGETGDPIVDSLYLHREKEFVAHLRYFRRRYSGSAIFTQPIEADKHFLVAWKDPHQRLVLAHYGHKISDMVYDQLRLLSFWVGPLEGEAIVVQGASIDSEPSNFSMSPATIISSRSRLGTTLDTKWGEEGFILPNQLIKDSVVGAVDKDQDTLNIEGREPFFNQPFSFKLPRHL